MVGLINRTVQWDPDHWEVSPGDLAKLIVLSTFFDIRTPLPHLTERFEGIDLEFFMDPQSKSCGVNSFNAGWALERIGRASPVLPGGGRPYRKRGRHPGCIPHHERLHSGYRLECRSSGIFEAAAVHRIPIRYICCRQQACYPRSCQRHERGRGTCDIVCEGLESAVKALEKKECRGYLEKESCIAGACHHPVPSAGRTA